MQTGIILEKRQKINYLRCTVVSCENRICQVIEVALTGLTVIVLALYLHIFVFILFDILRITVRTENSAIWPAVLTDHLKAGLITDEI